MTMEVGGGGQRGVIVHHHVPAVLHVRPFFRVYTRFLQLLCLFLSITSAVLIPHAICKQRCPIVILASVSDII